MKKILSVIIPVYNGAKYVTRAVESVINQPCSDFLEIVIINDGSTDNSGEVCDSLASTYNSVKVIHKKNEGVSVARNIGIEKADGKFVAFMDCDDWWEGDFFDEQIKNEFEANDNCDIFQFAYKHVDFTMRYEKTFNITQSHTTGNSNNSIECDYRPHPTYMYKTGFLIENNLLFPVGIKIAEDIVFLETCHFLARSKIRINKPCYNYLMNSTSAIHTTDHVKRLYEYVKCSKFLTDFYARYGVAYNVNHLNNIAKMLPELCANNSYSYCKDFFVNNGLADEFKKDKESLPKKSRKCVKAWIKHPRMFWWKAKLFTKPFLKIKKAVYRNRLMLKFASFLKHKFGHGWVRLRMK